MFITLCCNDNSVVLKHMDNVCNSRYCTSDYIITHAYQQEVNKGAYAKSDMYLCHAVVHDTKNVLLVTHKYVVPKILFLS